MTCRMHLVSRSDLAVAILMDFTEAEPATRYGNQKENTNENDCDYSVMN